MSADDTYQDARPCPFCGSRFLSVLTIRGDYKGDKKRRRICCLGCQAEGPWRYDVPDCELWEAWNQRPASISPVYENPCPPLPEVEVIDGRVLVTIDTGKVALCAPGKTFVSTGTGWREVAGAE